MLHQDLRMFTSQHLKGCLGIFFFRVSVLVSFVLHWERKRKKKKKITKELYSQRNIVHHGEEDRASGRKAGLPGRTLAHNWKQSLNKKWGWYINDPFHPARLYLLKALQHCKTAAVVTKASVQYTGETGSSISHLNHNHQWTMWFLNTLTWSRHFPKDQL